MKSSHCYIPLSQLTPVKNQRWEEGVEPIVVVRILTYNHEKYIRECLDSILIQETIFPVRIAIFEDCSTDKTAEIVKEYEAKYPEIITAFCQKENTYQKSNRAVALQPWYDVCFEAKYVAICEGDDCWLSPHKLQQQFEALEKHSTIDMCIHSAVKHNLLQDEKQKMGVYSDKNGIVSTGDIIQKTHGQIPTASTFLRVNVLRDFLDFSTKQVGLTVGDIYIHFYGSIRGGAYYINESMSLYREFVQGSFTLNRLENPEKKVNHIVSRVNAYNYLNTTTDYMFDTAIRYTLRESLTNALKDIQLSKQQRVYLYRHYSGLLDKQKAIYFFLTYTPYLLYLLFFVKKRLTSKQLKIN